MALPVRLSSIYDGSKFRFVVSDFALNDLESFKEFVCTGERGANSRDETVSEAGGGIQISKLEGVLPAAAFFSICNVSKTH